MAREAMTLLQNKNHILPLSKSLTKIAVIGPNADEERMLWVTIMEHLSVPLPFLMNTHQSFCQEHII